MYQIESKLCVKNTEFVADVQFNFNFTTADIVISD